MDKIQLLPPAMQEKLNALPPKISIKLVAAFFDQPIGTINKQIDRKTFPVRVHHIEGADRYCAIGDLVKFCLDGEPQPQPALIKRSARNPHGRLGKAGRGRPTKVMQAERASLAILQTQQLGACYER